MRYGAYIIGMSEIDAKINNTPSIAALPPKLYLCATPIGNMGDMTGRVMETLKRADVIFCEDTRNSGAMLARLDIKKPLESCHDHNEVAASERVIKLIAGGKAVAYVSDAGMPCISDPGERLVAACIENGVPFEVLPGASASLTAAIMSGLSTKRIFFAGFLPRENRERNELIAEIMRVTATVVLYESPYRVGATLNELLRALGDRRAAVVREITKLHEEAVRGTLSSLAERYSDSDPRGECVIVISGEGAQTEHDAESMDDMLLRLLGEGMSVKDAAKQAALMLDVPKSEAYARANELKKEL